MIIRTNISGLNAFRELSKNERKRSNLLEKLSSGLRIRKAADDAAGLSISEKMRAQIRGTFTGGQKYSGCH
ncbi:MULTISPECIES: flagellin [Sporomusa]|uniref:flagellin N-terminal helical domain-containing protein n=1 Tax=Sporomusa TaxID=2375 RepID=UPI00095175BE